jgi:hypothetical protein
MGLIGRLKKFPLPQALVLQYSLNQWKIAGVQSDPLWYATNRQDCFMIPTYLLYRAEKLTGFQLVKNSLHFMEPEGSLPHSQVPAACP